jgi:hypothetical protein
VFVTPLKEKPVMATRNRTTAALARRADARTPAADLSVLNGLLAGLNNVDLELGQQELVDIRLSEVEIQMHRKEQELDEKAKGLRQQNQQTSGELNSEVERLAQAEFGERAKVLAEQINAFGEFGKYAVRLNVTWGRERDSYSIVLSVGPTNDVDRGHHTLAASLVRELPAGLREKVDAMDKVDVQIAELEKEKAQLRVNLGRMGMFERRVRAEVAIDKLERTAAGKELLARIRNVPLLGVAAAGGQ